MSFATGPPNIPSTSQKWKLVLKLTLLYGLLAPLIPLILTASDHLNIGFYKWRAGSFFYPWAQFWSFFEINALNGPILQETLYRGPVWLLAVSGLVIKQKRINFLFVCTVILIPNFFWASTHFALSWAVFLAGLGWGWLVYKTKSLWPAIVCRSLANTLIYLAIKLMTLHMKI